MELLNKLTQCYNRGNGDKTVKTSKLYLASALISLGAGLRGVDKSDPRHMEFDLTYSSPLSMEDEWFRTKIWAWENRLMQVNAQEFVDAIQQLKGAVHTP